MRVDHQRPEQVPARESRDRVQGDEYPEVRLDAHSQEADRRNHRSQEHEGTRAAAVHYLAGDDARQCAGDRREGRRERELPHLPAQIVDHGSEEHADYCGADSHPRELAYQSAGDDPPAVEGFSEEGEQSGSRGRFQT